MVAGNWKMNTGHEQATALASAIAEQAPKALDVVVCPPFPWLLPVKNAIGGSAVLLGAQNCWTEPSGAFTGEVAPEMLAELCTFVILGHSERRTILHESDELVSRKIRAALRAGLRPIICVGESREIRDSGRAEVFVEKQIHSALDSLMPADLDRCTIAYEPIWAIGTGASATIEDIESMSASVRRTVAEHDAASAESMRVLYGGSVNPGNFAEIIVCSNVDGALVGGASLKAESFVQLAEIAAN
jgi:triosephosphate isomerase